MKLTLSIFLTLMIALSYYGLKVPEQALSIDRKQNEKLEDLHERSGTFVNEKTPQRKNRTKDLSEKNNTMKQSEESHSINEDTQLEFIDLKDAIDYPQLEELPPQLPPKSPSYDKGFA